MKKLLWALLNDEEGQGMVEYGIIVALIAVVVIGAVKVLGEKTSDTFTNVSNEVGKVTTPKGNN